MANELKDKKNYKLLMDHSQNYKNLFDPSTGFWRGRLADGSWIKDFRPNYPYYAYQYREADAWNSLFFAPHDPYGMVKLYPSNQAVEQKLDSLFTTPNGGYEAWNLTGFLGTYCHGNQPGHSIPFTYYFIDKQEKAQHVLNTLLNDYYGMGEEGLAYAGMDDAGEMSSWYVLNAIGIYTYSPADPRYIVTVPLFDRVDFTLGTNGKTFTIKREGNGVYLPLTPSNSFYNASEKSKPQMLRSYMELKGVSRLSATGERGHYTVGSNHALRLLSSNSFYLPLTPSNSFFKASEKRNFNQ